MVGDDHLVRLAKKLGDEELVVGVQRLLEDRAKWPVCIETMTLVITDLMLERDRLAKAVEELERRLREGR